MEKVDTMSSLFFKLITRNFAIKSESKFVRIKTSCLFIIMFVFVSNLVLSKREELTIESCCKYLMLPEFYVNKYIFPELR